MLAEWLGMTVFVAFGVGGTAHWVLLATPQPKFGNWIIVAIGWGFGLAIGLYICAEVTGGHLNPAVTLTMAIFRRKQFRWVYVLPYWFAQYFGGFCGAALAYAVWVDAWNAFDGGHREVLGPTGTASIFANYPAPYMGSRGGYVDQLVETTLFILAILAFTDKRNFKGTRPGPGTPFLIGFTLFLIGVTFGANTGFAVNPARDFGPRAFSAIIFGSEVFRANHWFWYVPIVGPYTGSIVAGVVYKLFIELFYPEIEKGGTARPSSIPGPIAPTPALTTVPPRTSVEGDLVQQPLLEPGPENPWRIELLWRKLKNRSFFD